MNNIKSLLSYLWTSDSDDALEDHVPGIAGDVSETREWMSNLHTGDWELASFGSQLN